MPSFNILRMGTAVSSLRGPLKGTFGLLSHYLAMKNCEIRLLGPTGMVAEIHVAGQRIACAITRARILLKLHQEMSGAEIRLHGKLIELAL